MGLRPTQGNEERLGPASALYGAVTLSLSSRPKRRDLRFLFPVLTHPREPGFLLGLNARREFVH